MSALLLGFMAAGCSGQLKQAGQSDHMRHDTAGALYLQWRGARSELVALQTPSKSIFRC